MTDTGGQRRVLVPLALALFGVVAGTALVPFAFPPSEAQTGVSTALGYNNHVAYIWYVPALLIAGLILARILPAPRERDVPDIARAWRSMPWRWVAIVVGAHVAFFAALFAYKGRFVFSEGIYFQALLHRMTQGELPYVDFSYWYGPSMIYPAHVLGTILGLEAGYATWHVVTYSIGLVFLFLVIETFAGNTRRTALLATVASVALFNPMTGLNFTLVRYLLPSIVFLLAERAIGGGSRPAWALTALLLSIAVLYSFETAALSIGAVVLVTAVHVAREPLVQIAGWVGRLVSGHTPAVPRHGDHVQERWRALAMSISLLLVAAAAFAAAFWAIDPQLRALAAYPEAARSDLAGSHNTPVYPQIPFLALTAVTLFSAGAAIGLVARAVTRGHLLIGAFLVLAIVAQRPSFSVSDPQHWLFFGLATLLLGIFLIDGYPAQARTLTVGVAIAFAGLVLSHQTYQASQLLPFFGPAASSAGAPTAPAVPRKAPSVEATLTEIAQRVGPDRPYLMYGLDYYSVPVHHRLGLRYASYDTDFNSVTTVSVAERLIGELRERNAVVLIERARLLAGRGAFEPDGYGNAVAWLTSAPMPGSDLQRVIVENDVVIDGPLLRFLRDECREILELDGIVALEPIG